jgi:hypothetical protein
MIADTRKYFLGGLIRKNKYFNFSVILFALIPHSLLRQKAYGRQLVLFSSADIPLATSYFNTRSFVPVWQRGHERRNCLA